VHWSMSASSRPISFKHRLYFSLRRLKIILPFYFAHHPLCEEYSQETLSFGQWILCRGCTFTYVSLMLFAIGDLIFHPFQDVSLYEGIPIALLLTTPVWIGLFFPFQSRTIKDLIRVALGGGWGISVGELWLRQWWPDKIVIIISIFIFWLVFVRIRKSRSSKRTAICSTCPQNVDTVCDGFKRQFDAEKRFNHEVDSFLWEESRKERQITSTNRGRSS
jgi:hypothetical protein